MYISTSNAAPNGALLTVHRIAQIVVNPDGAIALLRSYANLSVQMIGWEERVPLPNTALSSDPLRSVADALIAPGAYLAGGAIIEEVQ